MGYTAIEATSTCFDLKAVVFTATIANRMSSSAASDEITMQMAIFPPPLG
jgi:hypothetical protein